MPEPETTMTAHVADAATRPSFLTHTFTFTVPSWSTIVMASDRNPDWSEVDRAIVGEVKLDDWTATRVTTAPSAAEVKTTAANFAQWPTRRDVSGKPLVEPLP
jgi:hypothetical protein